MNKCSGHLPRKPVKGDVILHTMTSGKIMKFLVSAVEYPDNVHDMFFADLIPLDYVDIEDIR